MPDPDRADLDIGQIARTLGTTATYRAAEVVFREGDPARHMYIVLRGIVGISSRERSIETIGPGDALGIVALIDGHTRSADAVAQTDVELAVLDARSFRHAVEHVPRFVWYVMEELARRLRATNAAL